MSRFTSIVPSQTFVNICLKACHFFKQTSNILKQYPAITFGIKQEMWQRTLKKITHFEKKIQSALNLGPNPNCRTPEMWVIPAQ